MSPETWCVSCGDAIWCSHRGGDIPEARPIVGRKPRKALCDQMDPSGRHAECTQADLALGFDPTEDFHGHPVHDRDCTCGLDAKGNPRARSVYVPDDTPWAYCTTCGGWLKGKETRFEWTPGTPELRPMWNEWKSQQGGGFKRRKGAQIRACRKHPQTFRVVREDGSTFCPDCYVARKTSRKIKSKNHAPDQHVRNTDLPKTGVLGS